jgi:hypothetical protein
MRGEPEPFSPEIVPKKPYWLWKRAAVQRCHPPAVPIRSASSQRGMERNDGVVVKIWPAWRPPGSMAEMWVGLRHDVGVPAESRSHTALLATSALLWGRVRRRACQKTLVVAPRAAPGRSGRPGCAAPDESGTAKVTGRARAATGGAFTLFQPSFFGAPSSQASRPCPELSGSCSRRAGLRWRPGRAGWPAGSRSSRRTPPAGRVRDAGAGASPRWSSHGRCCPCLGGRAAAATCGTAALRQGWENSRSRIVPSDMLVPSPRGSAVTRATGRPSAIRARSSRRRVRRPVRRRVCFRCQSHSLIAAMVTVAS